MLEMVKRRNIGFDFGAWSDAAVMLRAEGLQPTELLLANDSVLGPIREMHTIFAAARQMAEGVVGLTESHQGGVHLQSYFMIALGLRATSDILSFLSACEPHSSKWLLVQKGEFGLTRYMLRRGHRVAALYGYRRVIKALLETEAERSYIASLSPALERCAARPEKLYRVLADWPVNPTHHLWHGLAFQMNFPFIKTSLIRHNNGRLPALGTWTDLILEGAWCDKGLVQDHLSRVR